MKANTLEKIYIVNDDLNVNREWYKTKQVGFDTTEYTRTDAFIEKAVDWITRNGSYYIGFEQGQSCIDKDFIDEFKAAMKSSE